MTKSQVVARLSEQDQEIADLKADIAVEVEKNKQPKLTTSPEYWIDASGNTKKKTGNTIVVKHKPTPKPKADSTTGLSWVGYCVEGCSCTICAEKRLEPSKTQVHDSKRVSKKPSTL